MSQSFNFHCLESVLSHHLCSESYVNSLVCWSIFFLLKLEFELVSQKKWKSRGRKKAECKALTLPSETQTFEFTKRIILSDLSPIFFIILQEGLMGLLQEVYTSLCIMHLIHTCSINFSHVNRCYCNQ